MPVPAAAVERYRRLEARLDALRGAMASQQAKFEDARASASRLSDILQGHARSSAQHLEVDEAGGVYWRELRRGQPVQVGTRAWTHDEHEVRRPLDDPAAALTGRQIAAHRAEAQRAMEARNRLSAEVQELAVLVDACEAELERRGWRRDGQGMPLTVRDNRMAAAPHSEPITRSAWTGA